MESRQRRRKLVVPLYTEAPVEEQDEDFEPSSQSISGSTKPAASKPVGEPSLLAPNAFAQFRLDKGKSSSKRKTNVNPVKALEQQLSEPLPDIAAPAQIASTRRHKKAKMISAVSTADEAATTASSSRSKPRGSTAPKVTAVVDLTSPDVEKKFRSRIIDAEPPRPEEPTHHATEAADDEIVIEESNNDIMQADSPHIEPEEANPPSPPVEPAQSSPPPPVVLLTPPNQLGDSHSPGFDYCPVCFKSLASLDEEARQYHTNQCLDGNNNAIDVVVTSNELVVHQPDGVFLHVDGRAICSLCSADVTLYNDDRRNNHADRCLNRQPLEGDGTMTGKRYACPLCSTNLSDRSIEHRVSHIRQCSAKKGISVAEMGKIIAERPLSARMPDLDAPAKIAQSNGGTKGPKNVNEARLQLAIALSASEAEAAATSGGSPALSDQLPTPSLGLTMESQLDLAGFRISQHHAKRAPHNISPNSKSRALKRSLLPGQIPFEDEESDWSNSSPPPRTVPDAQLPQSALASKYQRQGGSPRKGGLNYFRIQGEESVDIGQFSLSKHSRSQKATRTMEPSSSASQQAPVAASQILPTQTATQIGLTQTGNGAVDALVDLFDQEDVLEDREKAPQPVPKKRAREEHKEDDDDKGQKRAKRSDLECNEDLLWHDHLDEASGPGQPPRLVIVSAASNIVVEDSVSEPPSPMDYELGDLGDSQEERRQSLGRPLIPGPDLDRHTHEEALQTSIDSDLKQIVANTTQKMKRLQTDLAVELLRLQNTYFAQVGKLTQEAHAEVAEYLESKSANLPRDRIQALRSQMFVEIGMLTTANAPPTLAGKSGSNQESLFQWAARQQSPSPPIAEINSSNDSSSKDSAVPLVLRKNDMSIIAMGSPSNNSSPEFKTPPPRIATPRRPKLDAALAPPEREILDLSSTPEDSMPAPLPQVLPNASLSRARSDPPAEEPRAMDIDDEEEIPAPSFNNIADSPPSPMTSTPTYSAMSLLDLRALASEYGLKSTLTKQQIVDQLQRIWRSKHGTSWSPHTVEAAAIQQAGLLNSPSPSPMAQSPAPALYTKNSVPEDELKQRIINAIKQDTALWQLILQFIPLEIEKIQRSIRKSGIKVSKEFLREFLHEKSVVIAKTKRL